MFATMGGAPVAALPAGFAPDGRPRGVQLLAAPGRDRACLDLARACERAAALNRR